MASSANARSWSSCSRSARRTSATPPPLRFGLRDRWSSASACGDGSGLVVGIVPPLTDRPELRAELTEALGLPVMVVPEDRPIPLGPAR
ncbi:hypothetical protein [Nocardioides sp. SYSU DS0663]|uniref:hypothetical protein n=1 Tax=Nocardioides sp. SYSU DS0663 TaxID=3416445 RepID=UPI003F4C3674